MADATTEIVRDPGPPVAARREGVVLRAGRRADIQGLRAVAVVLVVAYHAGLPLPGGFAGVDMFFVISGFVIATGLVDQLGRTSTVRAGAFYTRRLRRLLPALAVLTTVVAICSAFLLSPLGPQQATAKTGIAASLFSANLQLGETSKGGYFDLAAETNALLHTWSLSVEEQFYLVFPAFLAVAWRLATRVARRFGPRRSPRRSATVIVLGATAASYALSCYVTYRPGQPLGPDFAFYSPVTRAWELGVGVLVALAAPGLLRLTRRLPVLVGVVGAALVVAGVVTIDAATPWPGLAALLPVLGTAALLVAGLGSARGITALLGVRPAVRIGDLSYGWYLWHWPLIVFGAALWPESPVALVVAAVVSLVPTVVSYRFVENRIRFDDRLTGRRLVPLVLACVLVPILACGALLAANRAIRQTPTVASFETTTHFHTEGKSRCYSDTPVGERAPTDCTFAVDDPIGTIFLVGDSNAEQFARPLATAANERGYDLTVAVDGACPFVDVATTVTEDGLGGPNCRRFVLGTVAALAEQGPALVVIASASTYYFEDDRLLTAAGDPAGPPEQQASLWEDGLTTVLADLEGAGVPTLVVHTVPHLSAGDGFWEAAGCPTVRIFAGSCGTSVTRDEVEDAQRPAREAEVRAVQRVPGVVTVDFTDQLCPDEICTTARDGRWFYRDATHLSVDGAQTLTDRFRALVAANARP